MRAPADTRTRFHRRQVRARLAAARPWLLGALVVGLVGFVGWILLFSSWLALERVDVSGVRQITGKDVRAAANLDAGTPLLRVGLDGVAERVESLPAVADVSVHRSWPHTISIDVTERQAVANIARDGGWWVMDREGVVYLETPQLLSGLPVVEAPSADEEALHEVASVVTALPPNVLSATVRVKARSMDSITLRLRDGREVVWGSAAETDRKVAVLSILLDHKARVYDVSVPEQPTTSD